MAYFKCPKNLPAKIYGVEWTIGSSSPIMTRTDDAADFSDPNPYYASMSRSPSSPFDNISPWKDMTYIVSSVAGVLTKIPKFYYKWTRSSTKMKLQISMKKEDGFLVSPAHTDRGDGAGERSLVYVGTFPCSSSDYKSTSGVTPKGSTSRSTFRTNIHELGSTYWQWDYAMLWTIRMLYLVEFANWNSQNTIGYGCSNSGAIENTGLAMDVLDNIGYHTGTNASTRTTYGHTAYRNIEDLWGNVYNWVDGIYFSSGNIYCIKNPADFGLSGGTLVGSSTASGCITNWTDPSDIEGFEYALYPSSISGTDYTVYIGDRVYYSSSHNALRVGGYYSKNQAYGMFHTYRRTETSTSSYDGSRLMRLP